MRSILWLSLLSVLALLSIFELLALRAVTIGNTSHIQEALASFGEVAGLPPDVPPILRNTPARKKRRTTLPGGYQSPVDTMLNNFPNDAVESEVSKHDRWVVDSIAYINTFSAEDAKEYAQVGSPLKKSPPKLMTMIILTVNRAVPYIAVTFSTLLRGHSAKTFMQYIDLHVVNIERRPGRTSYTYFSDLQSKLNSFITFHDWQAQYKETEHIVKMNKPLPLFMENQRIDIIRSLKLCKERNSEWCLVVEDDAVFPVNFMEKFLTYVNIDKYENASLPGGLNYDSPPLNATQDNSTRPVYKGRVAMVKLYVPFNDKAGAGLSNGRSGGDLKASDYNMDDYHRQRALDLYETDSNDMHKTKYSVRASWTMYGAVANAYRREKLDILISYLSSKKRFKAYATDTLLNYDFIVDTKMALLETHPSMVGHIGYYREHKPGAGIGEISTDIRFQLDDRH